MAKSIKIKDWDKVLTEITQALDPYKEKPTLSQEFIVEEDPSKKIQIRIKYPGKKVRRRFPKGKTLRKGSIPWANLYDFMVAAYYKGRHVDKPKFQWRDMLADFCENKIESKRFWKLIENVYKHNKIDYNKVSKLPGIDPTLFLMMLKWMWIQEDLNYRYSSKDIPGCPTPYKNETKGGSTTKGAGRGKFYASLLLVKHHGFTPHEVGRIVP